MECQVKFIGKEFHEKKTFDSTDKALDFIERNKDKIYSVNTQPIRVFSMLNLSETRMMTREELNLLLLGKDPFERTFYQDLMKLGRN